LATKPEIPAASYAVKFHAANPQENQDKAVSDGMPPHGFHPLGPGRALRASLSIQQLFTDSFVE
jgi:hypothetical protein